VIIGVITLKKLIIKRPHGKRPRGKTATWEDTAMINGIRPNIRTRVLQQGVGELAATIKRAKIAEAASTADPITSLLVESIKII
jgi:hypothetical protein